MSNIRQRLKERKAQIAQLVATTVKSAEAAIGHSLTDGDQQTTSTHSSTPAVSSEQTATKPSLTEDSKPVVKRMKLEDDLDTNIADEDELDWKPEQLKQEETDAELVEEKPKPKDSIEALLSAPSAREKESRKMTNEILDLLNKPTAKELALIDKFKSDGSSMREFCPRGTKRDCAKASTDHRYCRRLHFRKIVQKHTDHSLGDCSFLNTCFHMDTCKYIHYEVDYSSSSSKSHDQKKGDIHSSSVAVVDSPKHQMLPPQWVQCDMRLFDLSVLGTFSVVMADPPWDIHMELPYGTMSDDEMRRLNVQCLQTEGLIFLWVTGRAMELGRECLRLWGYKQCDEIIWVKTNQLQRIIRTGRTGHWLNHGKEHCLIGIKGLLDKFHVGLDCDVIVGEVRATSHKPDEIYGIIERLSPGTRKIELFGRQHNVQPNWITLGNQLDGVRLVEPDIVARFKDRYPDGNCMPKPEEIMLLKQRKPQRGRGRGGGRRF